MDLAGKTIGWIGIGNMGSPMSRRLIGAGAQVTVFDLAAENMAAAVAAGAKAAATSQQAAAAADIAISTIPNDAALRHVALGGDGILAVMRPGSVFIDMSTVSPEASAEVAEAAAAAGVDFLRATISGSTVLAETGKLTIMVSGPQAAYEACRPVFAALAAAQYYLGAQEQARYMKLVLNLLIASLMAGMAEALALGRKGGLEWQSMLDVIGDSVIAGPLVKYSLPPLKARRFAPAFSANLMTKDLGLICAAAARAGVPSDVAQAVRRLYEATVESGQGADNLTAVIRQIERQIGLGEPD